MFSKSLILLFSVVCSRVIAAPAGSWVPILKHPGKVQENSYIIQLKPEASKSIHLSRLTSPGLTLRYSYDQVFHGYAAQLDSTGLDYVRRSSDVAAVFEDGIITTNAYEAPSKSDGPNPLSRFNPNLDDIRRETTAPVDVYDIGTGIYTAHTAFGGRAYWGATFGGYNNADGNGFSTCLAGIAVGATYGVTTQANIYAVKAMSDSGAAATSDIIAGINWVISSHRYYYTAHILPAMLGALGALTLALGLVSAAPTSPGECKPLSSLSFAHRPNVTSGLSTRVIFNGLTRPRGLRLDSLSNLLVIDRGVGVVALSYRNDSTCVGWEKRTVVENRNLNHGIEIGPSGGNNQYLYASTSESVFRWEYDPSSVAVVGNPVTIASNMSNSDHTTRTLILQPQSGNTSQYIIVTRGSESNLDEGAAEISSGRSQIRRFALNSSLPSGAGWAWEQGELLGWGLRNAVGIALSPDGEDLWEVENSSDNVFWRGVDVHQENPSEELNRIRLSNISSTPDAQRFYGYPWCYTAWDSSALTASSFTFSTGSQFSIRNPPETPDDAWCSADQNNIKPVLSMQSHSAPLDIVFYNAPSEGSEGYDTARMYAVNTEWSGDAFVSFHGSWNRDPPTGESSAVLMEAT
ncbi:unnamed protein product [Rhizoctonia solani]|uniref:Uncharacterized protein n=1 Tax=Rhizoctonia solani TaxID=456999 RepID=A0A8H3BG05_9AGAM|nr:unnamed protein product [Rhizoctonia solani]